MVKPELKFETAITDSRLECLHSSPLTRIELGKRFWTALAVIILTLLTVESCARFLAGLGVPSESWAKFYDAKYQLAQRPFPAGNPSIVIIGDSLADFAISPELMASELQSKGYDINIRNLASPGNTVERSLFLLKTTIKSGNHPNLVIYDLHPRLFNQTFLKNDKLPNGANDLFRKSYVGSCIYPKLNWEGKMKCFLKKNSYLFRYRSYFKKELMRLPQTLLKPEERLKLKVVEYPEVEISPQGWRPGYKIFSDSTFMAEYSKPVYYKKIGAELDQYRWTDYTLDMLARFCKKEKIPLIAVWLPGHRINDDYYRHYHVSEEYFNQQFRKVSSRHHIEYLNLHRTIQNSQRFYDPDHLNTTGAMELSSQLASELTRNPVSEAVIKSKPKP